MMQDFINADVLDCEEDEYAFARPYIDMLLDYFSEWQTRTVTWDDPGYAHLAEDEVRVVLKKPRIKRTVEIIIVPSSRPCGADFGYVFADCQNSPLEHRHESEFLTYDELIAHIMAILDNRMCAFIAKDYKGKILSGEMMWTDQVCFGKRRQLLFQTPDDQHGNAINIRSVREIQICFWSERDRTYHY